MLFAPTELLDSGRAGYRQLARNDDPLLRICFQTSGETQRIPHVILRSVATKNVLTMHTII